MSASKALARGDACPGCGGELRAARVLDAKAFARTYDRETPAAVPPHTDTASPDVRADLGELWTCHECGYKTRFPAAPASSDAAGSTSTSTVSSSGDRLPAPGGSFRPTGDRPTDLTPPMVQTGGASVGLDEAARLRARIAELERQAAGGSSHAS